MPLISALFSFLSICKVSWSVTLSSPEVTSVLNVFLQLYFVLGSIIMALTYINAFALAAPLLVLCLNILANIVHNNNGNSAFNAILKSSVELFIPLHLGQLQLRSPALSSRTTKRQELWSPLFKMLFHCFILGLAFLIANTDFDVSGFVYSESTIFNNVQANSLLLGLASVGILAFIGDVLHFRRIKKRPDCVRIMVDLINLGLAAISITLAILCAENKEAFLTFYLERNHTISLKVFLPQDGFNQGLFMTTLVTAKHLERDRISRLARLLEDQENVDRANYLDAQVELILLKMKGPFQPSTRKFIPDAIASLNKSVVIVSEPDWDKLPMHEDTLILTKSFDEVQPEFSCWTGTLCYEDVFKEELLEPIKSWGIRTRECYWLGLSCEFPESGSDETPPIGQVEMRPDCSSTKLCRSAPVDFWYEGHQRQFR